jgi:hypothetical protein
MVASRNFIYEMKMSLVLRAGNFMIFKAMNMKYKLPVLLLMLITFSSCKNTRINFRRGDMENTILIGSTVKLVKSSNVKVNDIVAFDYYDYRVSSNKTGILRVVGTNGDKILFRDGNVFENDSLFQFPSTSKKSYYIKVKDSNGWEELTKYSSRPYSDVIRMFFLTKDDYLNVKKINVVDTVTLVTVDSLYIEKQIVSNNHFKSFNSFYFGPLFIPKIGDLITEDILKLFPQSTTLKIGDRLREKVFFLAGDNLHWCHDSRHIGLILQTSITGIVKTSY